MALLRIGIIGAGRIARAHLNACADNNDLVQVTAIADINEEAAKALCEEYKVGFFTNDYSQLASREDVDAVIICLPHHLHYEAVKLFLEHEKHVLVEKPLATSGKDAVELCDLADSRKVNLMVGQSRRFSDAVSKIMELKAGMGPINRIVTNFMVNFPQPPTSWWKDKDASGELILSLQAIHYFDLFNMITGSSPERVFAATRQFNPVFNGSDEADVTIWYPGNVTACIHLSLSCNPQVHETVIVMEKGTLRLTEYPVSGVFAFGYKLVLDGETVVCDGPQNPSNYSLQLKEFADSIKEGRQPFASGREAVPAVLLLERSEQSARTEQVAVL